MIRLLAVILSISGPAMAAESGWPALYDVTGVAAGDALNVRAEPGTAGEIIGSLPPDATDIEVIRTNEGQTWGLVNLGERAGWASLRFLARQSAGQDDRTPDFTTCLGTEPFWSLHRANGALELDSPDSETPAIHPIDWEDGPFSHRGRRSFRAGDLVGIVSSQSCGDGMSDREYGLELNLIVLPEARHLQGCCTIRPRAE